MEFHLSVHIITKKLYYRSSHGNSEIVNVTKMQYNAGKKL